MSNANSPETILLHEPNVTTVLGNGVLSHSLSRSRGHVFPCPVRSSQISSTVAQWCLHMAWVTSSCGTCWRGLWDAVIPTNIQHAYIQVPPEWLSLNGKGTPTVPAGSWRPGLGVRAHSLPLLIKTLKTYFVLPYH